AMKAVIKLTDVDLEIIEIVVFRFIKERKPTPRRQLLLKFEDPDILEALITRSLLRDVNRQAVLPSLLAFDLLRDESVVELARESLQTVLQTLRAFYLGNEEDRQITPSDIEVKAKEIGRSVGQDTVWLGLYLVQNYFGIITSSGGFSENGQ